MYLIKNICDNSDSCNMPFKHISTSWFRFRHVVYLDRMLACIGEIIFGICFSSGIFLVPAFIFILFYFDQSSLLSFAPYGAYISFISAQLIMAYLREAFFYDSFSVYAFFGFIFGMCFIVVCAIEMWIVGILWQHIMYVSVFQITALCISCINA